MYLGISSIVTYARLPLKHSVLYFGSMGLFGFSLEVGKLPMAGSRLSFDIFMASMYATYTNEPPRDKTNKMACAPSEDR